MLFHNTLIKKYNTEMFETLLYKHHLTHITPKLIEFDENYEQQIPSVSIKGYLLSKNHDKFLLKMKDNSGKLNLEKLPIRVKKTIECVTKAKDIVKYIESDFTSFSITPKQVYNIRQIFDMDGIMHPDMEGWYMKKIITFSAYCSRINIIMSGASTTGKTSYPDSIGKITDKGYVVKQPRSVLGLSYGLRKDGYIVLDEIGGIDAEGKRVIGNYLFQQGELSDNYKTGKGKSAAHGLLHQYDIHNQSCLLMCNLYEDYLMIDDVKGILDPKNKDKFIHYMFGNSQAINSRFLHLRPELISHPLQKSEREKLNIKIDSKQFTEENLKYNNTIRDSYIGIFKSLEWYNKNWDKLVDWEFINKNCSKYSNDRFYHSYRNILAGIYIYAKCFDNWETVFEQYRNVLTTWNNNYFNALIKYNSEQIYETDKVENALSPTIKDKETIENYWNR